MKRVLAILLTVLMVVPLILSVPALGEGAVEEPIVFEWFVPDPYAKIPPDDSPVMQQIFDATGVRFKWIIPPAEPEERYNLMLVSDEMPDLITFWDAAIMKQYIQAGKILKLNDLLSEYASNTFNINWEADVKEKIVDENGEFWFIPGGYSFGGAEPEANYAFNVRTDFFEENGYSVPETIEDYADLLRDVHEWNPAITPLGLALGPQGHIDDLVGIAASTYGLGYEGASYLLDEEKDELVFYSQSDKIKSFFKFLNGLNVEGLMDPESPIMSAEMLKQKMVGEQLWSFIGSWWEINSEVIAYEESIGSNIQSVYLFPKADESVEKVTYAPYAVNMYQAGLTLTTSNKDPERFMRFYEYANTEEGWKTLNGIFNENFTGENTIEATEGYDYVIRQDNLVDGKPTMEASAWMGEMWGNDENWWWNRGVESMFAFTYNGFVDVHPQGTFTLAPVDVSVWWDENSKRVNAELGWTGPNYVPRMAEMGLDNSAYTGLVFDFSWPEYTQLLAIRKLHEDTLPRIIMAESAEAFEEAWSAYQAELEKLGLSQVMAKYNELYKARQAAWANVD